MKSRMTALMRLVILGALMISIALPQAAQADTIRIVNTVDDHDDGVCDSSHCSLREAIHIANDTIGITRIHFNIRGPTPHVISLCSPMPPIEAPGLVIDGTSEPDYAGVPVVVLEPRFTRSDPHDPFSICTSTHVGLFIDADNVTVRGLSLVAFDTAFSTPAAAILIANGEGGLIEDNYIGVMPDGTPRSNKAGVLQWLGDNTVRGNLLSGNHTGVRVVNGTMHVEGNLIGTNPYGTGSSSGYMNEIGVRLDIPSRGYVGGALPEERNIISGNTLGIEINTSDSFVQGNYIGTDITGMGDVYNNHGIDVNGNGNLIGGSAPGEGNLISGNITGISIGGVNNMVFGNWIGVDATGLGKLENYIGMSISGGNNVIGNAPAGSSNVISGNYIGIFIAQSGMLNHVLNNYIGPGADGTTPVGGHDGVIVTGDENIIGGLPGAGNLIADLDADGVRISTQGEDNRVSNNQIYRNRMGVALQGVFGTFAQRNTISQNAIADNAQLGIDLLPWGVTANDAGDSDDGPNSLLNYPEASVNGTVITGTTCIGCTVELFLADDDPSGFGEGETFLDSAIANMAGSFMMNVSSTPIGICRPMTLTATDSQGNTSEFSENIYVGVCLHIPFPWLLGIWVVLVGTGGALGGRRGGGRFAALGAAGGAAAGVGLTIVAALIPNIILELPQKQPEPAESIPYCNELLVPGSLSPQNGTVFETYELPVLTWEWSENVPSEGLITEVELNGPAGLVLSRFTEEESLSFSAFDLVPSPGSRYTWFVIGGTLDESGAFDPICRSARGLHFQIGEEPDLDLSVLEPLETPEETDEPTPTPTTTPQPPEITAFQNTTCRYGPDPIYVDEGYLLEGETAPIHGKNQEETWWWIENPDWEGHCWVWGGSGEVTGDTSMVPVIAAPPIPTPEPPFCTEDLGPEECEAAGGTYIESLSRSPYCQCPQ